MAVRLNDELGFMLNSCENMTTIRYFHANKAQHLEISAEYRASTDKRHTRLRDFFVRHALQSEALVVDVGRIKTEFSVLSFVCNMVSELISDFANYMQVRPNDFADHTQQTSEIDLR